MSAEPNRATSETYLTDPEPCCTYRDHGGKVPSCACPEHERSVLHPFGCTDDGDAAIARERDAHQAADDARGKAAWRDPEVVAYIQDAAYEGLQRELAFKQKLREMREGGSIPSYHGPRAAK